MMPPTKQNFVNTLVPLPHLGENRTGLVVSETWSPALGRIWRVQVGQTACPASHVVYGDELAESLAVLARTAQALVSA